MADQSTSPAAAVESPSVDAVAQATSSYLTPHAALFMIMRARCDPSQPDSAPAMPALNKLVLENRKVHADAIEYWCDTDSSLLTSQKQTSAKECATGGPRWHSEADAAATEDAVMLSARVTEQCVGAWRRSATQLFDEAVMALVKTSSYAQLAPAPIHASGGLSHPPPSAACPPLLLSVDGDGATAAAVSSTTDEDEESPGDSIMEPLTGEEAVRRYQDCCLVFHATPLPTVVERLSRARQRDTSGSAPLSSSLKSNSVMSSSGRTLPSTSASSAVGRSQYARQLPGVDYVPIMPNPTLINPPSSVDADLSERSEALNVSDCPHLGETDAFIPFLGFLHGLSYLTRINLSKTDLQNACFSVFLLLCTAYLPNLDDIDASYNVRLSDGCAASVFRFLRQSPQFRRLNVKGTAMRAPTVARIERYIRHRSLPIVVPTEAVVPKKLL